MSSGNGFIPWKDRGKYTGFTYSIVRAVRVELYRDGIFLHKFDDTTKSGVREQINNYKRENRGDEGQYTTEFEEPVFVGQVRKGKTLLDTFEQSSRDGAKGDIDAYVKNIIAEKKSEKDKSVKR